MKETISLVILRIKIKWYVKKLLIYMSRSKLEYRLNLLNKAENSKVAPDCPIRMWELRVFKSIFEFVRAKINNFIIKNIF